MDINGKILFLQDLNTMTKGVIDLMDYSNGLYIVVLTSEEEVITQKIIKQ